MYAAGESARNKKKASPNECGGHSYAPPPRLTFDRDELLRVGTSIAEIIAKIEIQPSTLHFSKTNHVLYTKKSARGEQQNCSNLVHILVD